MKRIFLICLLVAACAEKRVEENAVIATVGEKELTLKHFRAEVKRIESNVDLGSKELRLSILDHLVNRELIIQKSLQLGFAQRHSVRWEVDNSAEQILFKRLIHRNLYPKIVEEKDLRDFYARLKKERAVRQILITYKGARLPGSTDRVFSERSELEAKKLANDVYEQLIQKKASFETLVQTHSDGESKSQLGEIGFMNIGRVNELFDVGSFEDVVYRLEIGEISAPFKTALGYHVIQVTEEIDHPNVKSFEEEKNKILITVARRLEAANPSKITKLMDELTEELIAKYNGRLRDENLALFLNKYKGGLPPKEGFQTLSGEDRQLPVFEYDGGAILVDEIMYNLGKNEILPDLNLKTMHDGVSAVARSRLYAKLAREQGLHLTQEEEAALAEMTQRLLYEEFYADRVAGLVDDSEDNLRTFYENNLNLYMERVSVKLQEIHFQSVEKAKIILEDYDKGVKFTDLVKKYSERDRSNIENNGETGYLSLGQLKENFGEPALSLNEGDVSKAFKTSDGGYSIIKVVDKKEAVPFPFEKVAEKVRIAYVVAEKQRLYDELIGELKKEFPVQIFEENLHQAYRVKLD